MVQRKDSKVVVPVGDTMILEGDKIVMIEVEHKLEFPIEENNNENGNGNGEITLHKANGDDESKLDKTNFVGKNIL